MLENTNVLSIEIAFEGEAEKMTAKKRIGKTQKLVMSAGLVLLIGILTVIILRVEKTDCLSKIYFQTRTRTCLLNKELGIIENWNKLSRASLVNADQIIIEGDSSGGNPIVADYWMPSRNGHKKQAFLLLHGSTHYGREHALIQFIGTRLYKKGYVVLAPDARGFGATPDPSDVHDKMSWRVKTDVKICIDFLTNSNSEIDGRIFVIGHSMGAAHALEGALEDSRVQAMILIGPPRYVNGTLTNDWERVRFSAVRNLPVVISEKVMVDRNQHADISLYAMRKFDELSKKRFLLMDGEKENDNDRKFLSRVFQTLPKTFTYKTIENSGHYCGVYKLYGTSLVLYNPDVFDPFMDYVISFLNI